MDMSEKNTKHTDYFIVSNEKPLTNDQKILRNVLV